MKPNPTASKVLFGSSTLIVVLGAAWINAEELTKKAIAQKLVVRSDDIGSRAEIHGKLGLPLGRMTTIQGRCTGKGDTKEYRDHLVFKVSMVDGVRLDPSLEILISAFGSRDNSIKVGRDYVLRGYEHGQFHGVPEEAYQEYIRGGKPPVATATDYSFRTEFVFVSAKQP